MFGAFDRLGYLRHRRRFRDGDLDRSLEGKRALVTGGNSGIGYATAAALARRGAHVTIACRDPARGARAVEALRRESGSSALDCVTLDVSELDAVREFAAKSGPPLDLLVHNAGLLPDTRHRTRDGLELTFATHVVGPHALTTWLLPRLRASGDARVVFVSSGGMYTQRLDLDDLGWERRAYDGVRAYAQTKRMQVVLAERWAEHLRGAAIAVYSMHPGWADTPGVERGLPRFYRLTRPVLRTAAEGADTVVWLAVVDPPAEPRGAFFFDREPRSPHLLPWTRERAETRDALWSTCERWVKEAMGR